MLPKKTEGKYPCPPADAPHKAIVWKALEEQYQKTRSLHLCALFADNPKRGERMTAEAVGIFLD